MRIAFFSTPMQGHLQPAHLLADELSARGHKTFLVCHPETESTSGRWERLFLDSKHCDWTPQLFLRHAKRPGFPFGLKNIVSDMAKMTNSLCQAGPALLEAAGVDAIVSDQMEPAGALIADCLDIPYVSLAAAHPINREPLVPLSVLPWAYENSAKAIKRNRGGERIANFLTSAHDQTIIEWSHRWALEPRRRLVDCLSSLADISQMFEGLDFPRRELAPTFHYVGPLRATSVATEMVLGPDHDSRPLVYASLGTLQGHRLGLFQRIATACRALDARLVVAHGGALSPRQEAAIDAELVSPWVSQRQLISQADAVVTHGGLNTVLDALSAGVPMLCLPLAFEQPGIGARVAWAGAGETLSHRASPAKIMSALNRILREPSYRSNAKAIGNECSEAGGIHRAASIAERALSTRRPVLRF